MNLFKPFVLFTILMSMTYNRVSARDNDVIIDGINYIFDTSARTAKVTKLKNGKTYSGSISIPESVIYKGKMFKVTAIDEKSFSDCSNLTSIALPNSVVNIGQNAFAYCI